MNGVQEIPLRVYDHIRKIHRKFESVKTFNGTLLHGLYIYLTCGNVCRKLPLSGSTPGLAPDSPLLEVTNFASALYGNGTKAEFVRSEETAVRRGIQSQKMKSDHIPSLEKSRYHLINLRLVLRVRNTLAYIKEDFVRVQADFER
ncbi:hypothetical protein RF11_06497 [Thelohanellus kitauei]|uniref:Uncharacterized protein n=1 Tax=Thelohanellus kitauei TaxID=669202 RepID=A0A0C2JBE7_THEKT|nr:hypothetical protein RF11_06497 [Thelohanellus kitauei]